jgi:Tol biopolymer transport system component
MRIPFESRRPGVLMKRFALLLLTVAVACVVQTPRDSNDDGDNKADAGSADAGVVDAGSDDAGPDAGELDAGEHDAGEQDAGIFDAGPDAGMTAYPRRWGTPQIINELKSSAYEDWPSMSADLLRICFTSERAGGLGGGDIYCAQRASENDPFGAPVNQASMNSTNNDGQPYLWRDELWFGSDRSGTLEIYRATWNSIAGTYGTATKVPELSGMGSDAPSLSEDGLLVFFESRRSSSLGQEDIYVASRSSLSEPFGTPVNVATLNSTSGDWFPTLAPDGTFIMFASWRPSHPANSQMFLAEAGSSGGWQTPAPLDIQLPVGMVLAKARPLSNGWLVASCAVNGAANDLYLVPPRGEDPPPKFQWGTPVPMAELNTSSIEAHPTMSADQLKICFASDRSGGKGGVDIWCATRQSATDPFGAPLNQAALNSSGYEANPALSSDGTELFYQAQDDLYRAVLVPAENAFKYPEAVTVLNSTSTEASPALTSDDLTIVFSSNRSGGAGSYDNYMAVRSSRASPFGVPVRLTDLNSAYSEVEPAVSPDGFTLLFDSSRPILNEQGQQTNRLFGATLAQGGWSTPELVQVDGIPDSRIAGAHLLPDGSLLFHRGTTQEPNGELFIAPPK